MRRCGTVAAAAAAWLLLAAGLTAGAAAVQPPLASLLPGPGEVQGWSRDGQAQEFAGDALFDYIDGGAEIYHEYGFRRVVVQDYANAAGTSVSLEIFLMADPGAAFGTFTFKRSGGGRPVPLGSAGELEDYYLNFWKGPYVVTLTGFDPGEATIAGLLAVGAAVDRKLGAGAPVPDIVAALPGEGLKPRSVKYLKGGLGLNNVYPLYLDRGLAFVEAVKADYENGTSVLVLGYRSEAEGAADEAALRQALGRSTRFERAGGDEKTAPVFRDPKGRFMALVPAGARLIIGLGSDPAAALGAARAAGLIGRPA